VAEYGSPQVVHDALAGELHQVDLPESNR